MNIPRNNRSRASHPPEPGAVTALFVGGLLVVAALAYYAMGHRATPSRSTFHMLVAADISGSESPQGRRQYFGVLEEAIETTLPVHNIVSIWTYDRNAYKVWGPAPLDKSRDLWPAEDAIIASVSRARGTEPSAALAEMVRAAKRAGARHEPVACLILTDGEDANPAATAKLAAELAALPNVKAVWLAGAKTEKGLRTDIERTLAPLGDRLVVSGPFDARESLNQYVSLVRG